MPGPIVKKIHDTFKIIIDEPRFEESLKRIGVLKAYRNSEELGQFLASQHKYWGDVVREMGVKKPD
jgi:tripartite-type tricarboxylate transporter receptor subunit TctC